jgi:hypothetical protein
LEAAVEVLPVEPLHREPERAVIRPAVDHVLDDARVAELGEHLGLACEELGGLGAAVLEHLASIRVAT